jgi:tetratricopeptide (TPR) repeat protein
MAHGVRIAVRWTVLLTAVLAAGGCASLRSKSPALSRAHNKPPTPEVVEDEPVKRTSEVVTNLGRMRIFLGQLEQATALFEEAIQQDPTYAPAYVGLAQAHLAKNEPEKAIAVLQQALPKVKTVGDIWNELGAAYAKKGQIDSAIAAARKAVDSSPDNRLYLTNLAGMLAVQGNADESYRYYTRVTTPGNARYRIAGVLYHAGKKDEAAQQLQLALREEPDHAPSALMLAQLSDDHRIQRVSY